MMRRIAVLISGLLWIMSVQGQVRFNQRYSLDDTDVGYGIRATQQGYLITGPTIHFDSLISRRIQAFEIDTNGSILFYRNYTRLFDWFYSSWEGNLIACPNNSYSMLGDIEDTLGDADFLLFKFNSQGDTLWTKRIYDQHFSIARNLCNSNDGGYALVGQWDSAATTQLDIVLKKTDSLGNIQWQQTFDQSYYDDALSVILTKDNGYLIGGFFRATALTHDALVIKTDSAGNQQWRKIIGNQYSQSVWDIVETTDSNFVITGSWQTNSSPNVSYKYWLMKLDKDSGSTIWQKFYDDTVTGKSFRSIVELDDGSIVCAGLKTFNSNQEPIYGTIFKFSTNGDSLWERNYLPPNVVNGWGYLNDIIATSDGGFIAVGEAGGDGLTQDTWILKVDSEGCEVWSCLTTDILEQHIKEPALIIVYPNPASGNQIQLKWNEILKQETQLQIFNSTGAIIFEKPIPTGMLTEQLDINSYANGLYFVRATGKDVLLQTRFVIIRD